MNLQVHDGLLQIVDVEHGQCALLTTPRPGGGFDRMMIDCGHNATTEWTPAKHLKVLGATTLERLVITNYDEDHVSGGKELFESNIAIQWLVRNTSVPGPVIQQLKSETGMGSGIKALVTALGDYDAPGTGGPASTFAGVTTQAFYNKYPAFDDENNLSLVYVVTIRGLTFMFPGDLECAGFEHLLKTDPAFGPALKNVNVLIASHHGRANGICPDVFDKWGCAPKLVVISDDYMQYDTQKTTQYYASKTSGIEGFRKDGLRKVLTTRNDGNITFSFQNGQCLVS